MEKRNIKNIDIYELDFLSSRVISMEKNLPEEIKSRYGRVYYKINEKMSDNLLQLDFQDKKVLSVLASSDQMLMLKSLDAKQVDVFDTNRLTLYYYFLRKWSIKYDNKLYPDIYNNNSILRLTRKVRPETELEAKALVFFESHLRAQTEIEKLFYDVEKEQDGDSLLETAKQAKKLVEEDPTFYEFNLFEHIDTDKTYDYIYISNILEWARGDITKLKIAEENLDKLTGLTGTVICTNLVSRDNSSLMIERRIFKNSFERYDFKDQKGYVYTKS